MWKVQPRYQPAFKLIHHSAFISWHCVTYTSGVGLGAFVERSELRVGRETTVWRNELLWWPTWSADPGVGKLHHWHYWVPVHLLQALFLLLLVDFIIHSRNQLLHKAQRVRNQAVLLIWLCSEIHKEFRMNYVLRKDVGHSVTAQFLGDVWRTMKDALDSVDAATGLHSYLWCAEGSSGSEQDIWWSSESPTKYTLGCWAAAQHCCSLFSAHKDTEVMHRSQTVQVRSSDVLRVQRAALTLTKAWKRLSLACSSLYRLTASLWRLQNLP